MELTNQQEALLEFVKQHHGVQKRKYTLAPYWTHLYSVAAIVSDYETEGIEIALCHDLFEDTECTPAELRAHLLSTGYPYMQVEKLVLHVFELTDQYVKSAYPALNRQERKRLEAERLGQISALAQSVKYADLMDNAVSIAEHDPKFAEVFLREKRDVLNKMTLGHPDLYARCLTVLEESTKLMKRTH